MSVSQPVAPGAVGWIPAYLGGMLAHPECLGVWGGDRCAAEDAVPSACAVR